jgi:hypothetical protein
VEARSDSTSGIQRLISYLVRITPSGNAARELDLRRCGARLLVGGWPVGAHRLPQFAPVQRQARRPHPVRPPLEQLVARYAPADLVAGRGYVTVQAQVHAIGQFAHGVSLP